MKKRTLSALLPLLLAGLPLTAQEKPQDKEPEKEKPPSRMLKVTPVRLQVVFTRYQGEKKVSSVPYTLSINADDRPGRIRMGIQVPIKTAEPAGSVQYRDVGNNLDCSAYALTPAADRFKVSCSFEQSSVYVTEADHAPSGSAVSASMGAQPLFRVFRSDTNLQLQDGQTALYTAATDPVSGEVLKIEVTLSVVR